MGINFQEIIDGYKKHKPYTGDKKHEKYGDDYLGSDGNSQEQQIAKTIADDISNKVESIKSSQDISEIKECIDQIKDLLAKLQNAAEISGSEVSEVALEQSRKKFTDCYKKLAEAYEGEIKRKCDYVTKTPEIRKTLDDLEETDKTLKKYLDELGKINTQSDIEDTTFVDSTIQKVNTYLAENNYTDILSGLKHTAEINYILEQGPYAKTDTGER